MFRRSLILAMVGFAALLPAATPVLAVSPEDKAEAEALRDACKADYLKVCGFTRPGGGRGLACLEAKAAVLSVPCREALPRAKALRDKLEAERG